MKWASHVILSDAYNKTFDCKKFSKRFNGMTESISLSRCPPKTAFINETYRSGF